MDALVEPARGRHIPDILDVIAALSSDAVPTPPVLARALLDVLPDEVWTNATDPAKAATHSPAPSVPLQLPRPDPPPP